MAGDAAHSVAPGAQLARPVLDGHPGGRVQRLQSVGGRPIDRGFRLAALRVQVLAEVSLAMGQRDRDHREPQVGGGAQRIAREDAKTAGVRRDGGLEGDLHREVGYRVWLSSLGAIWAHLFGEAPARRDTAASIDSSRTLTRRSTSLSVMMK